MHRQFYIDCVDTIASKEDSVSKKQIVQPEIWYARFPPGKKCGRSSRAVDVPRTNRRRRSAPLEDPDEDDEVACPGPAIDGNSAGGEGSAGQ